MKPVSNWRDAWKWHSTQLFTLLAVLPVVWAELPPEIKMLIPAEWQPYILAGLAVSGAILRLRDQGAAK